MRRRPAARFGVFQPQVASWDGQRKHGARMRAVSYSPKGATKPALGTVKLEADTAVAVDERLVNFTELKLTESNFPGAAERSAQGSRRARSSSTCPRARW